MEKKWEPMSFDEFEKTIKGHKIEKVLHDLHIEFVQCANQMWNTQTTVRNVIESQNELNGHQSVLALSLSERVLELEKLNLKMVNYMKNADTPIGHDRRLKALEKRETFTVVVLVFLAFAILMTGAK